jgi:DNA-binding transcriptional LysR family regulator
MTVNATRSPRGAAAKGERRTTARPDHTNGAVEFRHLQYFVAVAEELHFGRAAERLFLSQPALSQAIAGLERALGAELFVRSRHNVELTDAGAELLGHARSILADRDAAVAGVRRVARGEVGVLRVGVALLAQREVAPAFGALLAESRELLLDRSSATSERLLASLEARELDAAVVYQVPGLATLRGIASEVIRRGRLAALVSESSALGDRRSVQISDLSEERFLAPRFELAPSSFEGMKAMCRAYGGFEPEVLELSSSSLPVSSADWRPIVRGDAIATMPVSTARAIQPEGTAVVPIEPPPAYSLALAWRQDDGSPLLRGFVEFLRAYREAHDWRTVGPRAGSGH